MESEYIYCSYLQEYITEGLCYDMQMIGNGYIKSKALYELNINKEKLKKCCAECEHEL